MKIEAAVLLGVAVAASAYQNELVYNEDSFREHVVSPRPSDYLKRADLPDSWDWRNVDGVSYVSGDLNQHIPVYCGSCWAHAAVSSVADRIRIATKNSRRDILPSIQVIINKQFGGSCNGGSAGSAYAAWKRAGGIPDVTCQQYEAKNNADNQFNTCRNCDYNGTCYAVPEGQYPQIKLVEHGTAVGDEGIMAEIYARGPVAASLNAECLEFPTMYTTGVNMYDSCATHKDNHEIQIAGWGVDEDGTPYWICRNSWGTYFGEDGWFRIIRGGNWNPAYAAWAVPDISDYEF